MHTPPVCECGDGRKREDVDVRENHRTSSKFLLTTTWIKLWKTSNGNTPSSVFQVATSWIAFGLRAVVGGSWNCGFEFAEALGGAKFFVEQFKPFKRNWQFLSASKAGDFSYGYRMRWRWWSIVRQKLTRVAIRECLDVFRMRKIQQRFERVKKSCYCSVTGPSESPKLSC